jgi:predicted RNase H-like HicB family nuclease
MTRVLLVRVDWDPEAKVWVADSDDVPGLATEAETVDALMAKLEVMIPELLELNGWPDQDEVPFELLGNNRGNNRGQTTVFLGTIGDRPRFSCAMLSAAPER